MTLTIVDLPAPLWPTSPTHSPGMTREGHAIECPDRAEAHLGAIDRDHRLQNVIMPPAMPARKECRAAIRGRAAVAGRFTLPTRSP